MKRVLVVIAELTSRFAHYIGDPDAKTVVFGTNMLQENTVSIKLPIVWTSKPHVWFAQAEAQFNI